ncbi:hypothetical protein BP6252_14088 [Coleophoma cylindrospora]|uniref:Prion-inhibition and propagation HeLo domain-containing protein n=1 Tax=Coleophoma cylindrospora TaxID=1849047 RepID=A0A3D8Q4F4_9HELO|nr:hypothetical protein BP6252_14088 [Coleophoma cylindrospora]
MEASKSAQKLCNLQVILGDTRIPWLLLERAKKPQVEWDPSGAMILRHPEHVSVPSWLLDVVHPSYFGSRDSPSTSKYVSLDPGTNITPESTRNLVGDFISIIAHAFPDAYAELGWENIDRQFCDLAKKAIYFITDWSHCDAWKIFLINKSDTYKNNLLRFLVRLHYLFPTTVTNSLNALTSALAEDLGGSKDVLASGGINIARLETFQSISMPKSWLTTSLEESLGRSINWKTWDHNRWKDNRAACAAAVLALCELSITEAPELDTTVSKVISHWNFSHAICSPLETLAVTSFLPEEAQLTYDDIRQHLPSFDTTWTSIFTSRDLQAQFFTTRGYIFAARGFYELAVDTLGHSLQHLDKIPTVDERKHDSKLILAEYLKSLNAMADTTTLKKNLHSRLSKLSDMGLIESEADESSRNLMIIIADSFLSCSDFGTAERYLTAAMEVPEMGTNSGIDLVSLKAALRLSKINRRRGMRDQALSKEAGPWQILMNTNLPLGNLREEYVEEILCNLSICPIPNATAKKELQKVISDVFERNIFEPTLLDNKAQKWLISFLLNFQEPNKGAETMELEKPSTQAKALTCGDPQVLDNLVAKAMSPERIPNLAKTEHEYIKCYSWIQGIRFSAVFETDFGFSFCKLNAVATHFSRWGTAMGFTSSSSSAPSAEECSEENVRKAKVCLSAINKAFSRAFEDGSETAEQEQTKLLDSQIQIGKSSEAWKALHVTLQEIQNTRVPRKKIEPSTRVIILYEKDIFDGLVRTVSIQIRRLNDLFPSLKAEQSSLSSDELKTIKDGRASNVLWLKEIVKSDDEFLSEALEQETSQRHFYLDIKVQDEFKGQFGHKFAKGESSTTSSTYKGIVAGGKGEVQFGNIYGSTM